MLALAPLPAQDAHASPRIAAWREDIGFFAERWGAMHPDPWHCCARDEFLEAQASFAASVAGWSDDRCVVELMRLVGRLGREREGHAGVLAATRFGHLPVRLYEFADGVAVVDAAPQHRDLIGARVLQIDGIAISDALAAVEPLMPCDGPANARVRRLATVLMPAVLLALGLGKAADGAVLRVVRAGDASEQQQQDVELVAEPFEDRMQWQAPGLLLPAAGSPRHLAHLDEAFRFEALPDGVVYAQYHRIDRTSERGETIAAFADRLLAAAAAPSARVVIDVRHNGGGDNTTYRPLIDELADSGCNRAGGLYLLIGPGTFSAAGNFAAELAHRTEAVLVGQATGGSPNQYGDARTVRLPRHGDLAVRIPTRWHDKVPGDQHLSTAPDIAVDFTLADWLAGRDPVLAAALQHRP